MEEKLKRELRKLSYKAKKLRGEFEKENNTLGTHFCDGYIFALERVRKWLK
jgi:hypothetical protein